MNLAELQQIVYDSGIVGAGGAGFPTHKKFSENVKQIVVNAAECEPLLMTDHYILRIHLRAMLDTLHTLIDTLKADEAIIGIKQKNLSLLDPKLVAELPENIRIGIIPDVYPAGDEVLLVYETTGKIIPEGNIPIAVGVMVINTETLYNLAQALQHGIPVYEKRLTICGDTKEDMVVKAPIGMKISDLFSACGIELGDRAVIDGGPMMGRLVDPKTAVVTKTTKGLLLLPQEHSIIQRRKTPISAVMKRASAACCNCRMCTDVCPRYLLGYSIEVHKTLRAASHGEISDAESYLQSSRCCGCGLCTVVGCQQMLNPQAISMEVKKELGKHGYRAKPATEAPQVRPERDGRRIPSARLVERLGIAKYVKKDVRRNPMEFAPDEVQIPLSMHVGKPASPIVSVGDEVSPGMPIARTEKDALGTTIHASISGVVSEIKDGRIMIQAKGRK